MCVKSRVLFEHLAAGEEVFVISCSILRMLNSHRRRYIYIHIYTKVYTYMYRIKCKPYNLNNKPQEKKVKNDKIYKYIFVFFFSIRNIYNKYDWNRFQLTIDYFHLSLYIYLIYIIPWNVLYLRRNFIRAIYTRVRIFVLSIIPTKSTINDRRLSTRFSGFVPSGILIQKPLECCRLRSLILCPFVRSLNSPRRISTFFGRTEQKFRIIGRWDAFVSMS